MIDQMVPLNRIKAWMELLPSDLQMDLICRFGIFHPEKEISKNLGPNQVTAFYEYIKPDALSATEIVSRTIQTVALIDFGLSGLTTNSGWDEAVDINLHMGARLKEEGHSTDFIDNFFEQLPERKRTWMNMGNSWNLLRSSELSDKTISEWWMQKFREDRK